MNRVALFGLLCVFPICLGHATEPQEVRTGAKLCGKLVSIKYIPDKGTINSSRQVVTPFRSVAISLFAQSAGRECCVSLSAVAEALTDPDGDFKFKEQIPGNYWVVATLEGAEYKQPIHLQSHAKSGASCSEMLYALENGKFHFARSITVVVTQNTYVDSMSRFSFCASDGTLTNNAQAN